MHATVENFLGHSITVPTDRWYDAGEGLWIRQAADGLLDVGITEPAVLMAGTVRDVEVLVDQGTELSAGDTVVLLLTARLKYIATPLPGRFMVPLDAESLADRIKTSPYETPLFRLACEADYRSLLLDGHAYAAHLSSSEGARNPGGHKGGVSPTCKAVYMGLGEQKIHR